MVDWRQRYSLADVAGDSEPRVHLPVLPLASDDDDRMRESDAEGSAEREADWRATYLTWAL